MHAIIKSSFYLIFMILMLVLGIRMLMSKKKFYKTFGIMTLILGVGETFHLIPRVLNIFSSEYFSLELLEKGQFISSITIVFVYILLYTLWKERYSIAEKKGLNTIVLLLGVLSVLMTFVLTGDSTLTLILKNIPVLLLGLFIIKLYSEESKKDTEPYFKFLHLALLLSFVFYLPVILLENTYEVVVILMLPKSIMYIWLVSMGYRAYKNSIK